jgi:hypothetical protein
MPAGFNVQWQLGLNDQKLEEPRIFSEVYGPQTAKPKTSLEDVAVAWPAYAEDKEQVIVRMDGLIRRNADVGPDEYVKVRKADVKSGGHCVRSNRC